MAAQSSHRNGARAVDAFLALPWEDRVTLLRGKPSGRGTGRTPDVTVTFADGTDVPVELKYGENVTGQVRSLAYQVLAVWRPTQDWWILGPDEVLRSAATKAAQHCLNPLECMNLGKPGRKWDHWFCEATEVPTAVKQKHLNGLASPLCTLAREFRTQIMDLAARQRLAVEGSQ